MNTSAVRDTWDWTLVRRFTRFFLPYRKVLLLSIGLMSLSLLFTLPMPWISMKAIDEAIRRQESRVLVLLLSAWGIATAVRVLINFAQGQLLMRVQVVLGQELRNRVTAHLLRLPLAYFSDKQAGYLVSRVFQDTEDAVGLFGGRVIDALRSSISLIAGIAVVFIINWKLALLSMAIAPLYFLNQFLYNRRIREKETQKRDAWSSAAGALQESLGGVYSVKAYERQDYEVKKFDRKCQTAIEKTLDAWKTGQLSSSILALVQGLGPIIILSYAGAMVLNKSLTIGELIGFSGYTGMLFGPISSLFDFSTSAQVAFVSIRRVFEVLDAAPEVSADTGMHPAEKPHAAAPPAISISDVSFSYNGNPRPALNSFSLDILPGEAVAIVGKTGSGKSTIANLLLRLYRPQSGEIRLDGVNIERIPLPLVREIVCVVPQEPFLFSGSLRENIRFGRTEATDSEIEAAARLANADEFISRLQDGYSTVIGERGLQLSGGQKQLISIARAFLRNPHLIILDEATSAVDSISESLIRSALKELMVDRTTIVISHRLSSVLDVSRVVVLHQGRLMEQGSHEELYARDGLYRRLFEEQLLDSYDMESLPGRVDQPEDARTGGPPR